MFKHWLAAAAALACVSSAQALITTVDLTGDPSQSTETTGSDFSGSLSFDDASNVLTVNLLNTTPAGVGGFLTAFAFNAPQGATVSFAGTTLPSFGTFYVNPNTAPFAGLEYGVAEGGPQWLGSGNPSGGLAVGSSATWTFNVGGGSFEAADFITAGSSGSVGFLTRFRGLANGGSDKVPGVPISPIPEPQTYALMLAGLGMLGFMARRRRAD